MNIYIKFLQLFFKPLPNPKDLGMSNSSNAMASRHFPNDNAEYTWEDYYEKIAELYPVRNFFFNSIPDFFSEIFSPLFRRITDFIWFFKYHLIKKYRYHFLDLRNKEYQYGYREIDTRMMYAMFKLLEQYFAADPVDVREYHTSEEIEQDEGMKQQDAAYQEAKHLLAWWEVGRFEEEKQLNELLDRWYQIRKSGEDAKELFEQYHQAEKAFWEKEDEMCLRLVKIRRSLWN